MTQTRRPRRPMTLIPETKRPKAADCTRNLQKSSAEKAPVLSKRLLYHLLTDLHERNWGMVAHAQQPDYSTHVAILSIFSTSGWWVSYLAPAGVRPGPQFPGPPGWLPATYRGFSANTMRPFPQALWRRKSTYMRSNTNGCSRRKYGGRMSQCLRENRDEWGIKV